MLITLRKVKCARRDISTADIEYSERKTPENCKDDILKEFRFSVLKNVTVKYFASCVRIWALSNRICCRLVLRNGTEEAKLRRSYYYSAKYKKALYVIEQQSLKEAQ